MKLLQPLEIPAYEFKDLCQHAQDRVLNRQIEFWMETREYIEEHPGNFEKAIDEANSIQTPWFTGSYILEYCKEELIEELESLLFDHNGDELPITYYAQPDGTVTASIEVVQHVPIEIRDAVS